MSSKNGQPGPSQQQEEMVKPKMGPDPWGVMHEDDTTDEDDGATWINTKRIYVIPRENPNDPFKVKSVKAIHTLAEQGGQSQSLKPNEEAFLQNYGADMDMDTPFHQTDPPGVNTDNISTESKVELQKLPSWLRTFIETKFNDIHNRYQNNTHVFLQMLVSRLEYRKLKGWSLLPNDEEEVEIQHRLDDEMYGESVLKRSERDDGLAEVEQFQKPDILQVAPHESDPRLWSPILMQRAADALRAVMLAGASDSEGEDPQEGEWEDDSEELEEMRNKRRSFMLQKDEESIYTGPHWEDVIARKQHFAEKARWEAALKFTPDNQRKRFFFKSCRRYDKYKKKHKEEQKKKQQINDKKNKKNQQIINNPEKKKENKTKSAQKEKIKNEDNNDDKEEENIDFEAFIDFENDDENDEWEAELEDVDGCCKKTRLKSRYYSTQIGHPLFHKAKNECQRRARQFRERGVGKRASRVYFKEPCKGPVARVTRELHQVRPTEGIHAYINFITSSLGFRNFILLVIMFNAVLLAAETEEQSNRKIYDMCDSIFLSVYLVEFMLKCYSNPLEYFRSGFNVFDFIILICSLAKACIEWTQPGTNYNWLRFFIIIRAMRVLRGVSLSVHTQVLVVALVETLKNHVLSVLVLLVLLMYIAAIVAFHLFSDVEILNRTWGTVPRGMLRLFSFVTMDGWTEIMEEFEIAGRLHRGRIFCFICIVFGNFVFSNIFIAIIIMQISEATDSFRKSQADERESNVFLKQEDVFRRQKLDMRQLLARHKLGVNEDFYELGSRFVRRLRHDDLVDTREVIFCPLWLDSYYKSMLRENNTSTVLMNLHRKMSDRLVKLNNLYNEGKSVTRGISRARYNRYLDVKARLVLLKQQFLESRNAGVKPSIKIKLPNLISTQEHARPPPRPPPMPKKYQN